VWITTSASGGRKIAGDEGVRHSDEGHSNAGLWIGLAIGGAVLLLLVVCGGIGGFMWLMSNRMQARQAEVQAVRANFGRPPAFGVPAIQPIIVPPTEFPPQTEDYAEARKKFKTKLIIEGPSPQPAIAMNLPVEAQEIEYPSGDLRLKAWVSRDPSEGKEKKPAVLYLHNGLAFGNDDWDQSKPFRDAGYVVMMPTLRGENNQPGTFSLFYDEVDDVLAAADALEKLPYVDSKRMYLAGHSSGATLTLLTALTSPRFRAAGAFSGSPDQTNWAAVRSNMPGFQGIRMEVVPFDEENEKEFHMRSPLAFAESFKCPVRVYYGDQETYFKACSEKLVEKAKKKKLDVEAVEVPGDHFSLAKTGAVNNAIPKCIEFFQKH
jgi:dipeptidyl aminopeptidase/acylaminoacyl peptidase